MKPVTRWGAMWHSKNHLDDVTEHLLYKDRVPVLFTTRQQARDYIKKVYGYIGSRSDLRAEPHGWRLPRPVRVEVRAITGWNRKGIKEE
ncbi:hypothetical protein LCGC14_0376530 [marine sediment metagenome]|uniref:Uncharacterized protein n=1 Tax=marine sediment metagenome TaxID=412755 RepID=A0A0F9TLL2_9ZZZZ